MGLDRVQNGELIRAPEENGFDALVTGDKSIGYQQNLTNRKIAILVLPSGQWPEIKVQLADVIEAIEKLQPGQ